MDIESRKICMVGDFGVGKTSSVARFVHNAFSEKYLTTIGVKVDTKVIEGDKPLKLVVWDIAGRNKFGNIEFTYLRGSAGYILVVDGTRASTLQTAIALRKSIEARYGKLPYVLLLNKSDLNDKWEVTDDEIDQLRAKDVPVFITSAKTGSGVEEAFTKFASLLV